MVMDGEKWWMEKVVLIWAGNVLEIWGLQIERSGQIEFPRGSRSSH